MARGDAVCFPPKLMHTRSKLISLKFTKGLTRKQTRQLRGINNRLDDLEFGAWQKTWRYHNRMLRKAHNINRVMKRLRKRLRLDS